jgi:hypothetical protein
VLDLSLDQTNSWFKPGDTVVGTAEWHLGEEADAIEVRLFWYTQGKGTQDVGVAAAHRFETPHRHGSGSFRLQVPRGPYSFSGRLISLSWAIELVVLPGTETERRDLIVGPHPVEVDIR